MKIYHNIIPMGYFSHGKSAVLDEEKCWPMELETKVLYLVLLWFYHFLDKLSYTYLLPRHEECKLMPLYCLLLTCEALLVKSLHQDCSC